MSKKELILGKHRFNDKEIRLPLSTLKKHIASLGASGSGKTVFCKVVTEEVTRLGVPSILIDPQGDLASLALLGDKKTVTSKGVPGEVFDTYADKYQIAIFTPSSTKGIPISINPLKPPPDTIEDREERIQALDAVASSLAQFLGFRSESDAGRAAKTYLYSLLEEVWSQKLELKTFSDLADFIKNDSNFVPPSISSILNEKEKAKLARKVSFLTVGADALIFNMGMPLDVESLLGWADPGKVPINVIYLNTLSGADDKMMLVSTITQEIYNWMLRNPSEDLQLLFYMDEISGYIPPYPLNPPSKRYFQLLFKQARKYGVALQVATQNLSDVDYKSLAQVNTLNIGRMLTKQDLASVKHMIESISPAEADKILSELPRLQAGQFMLLSPDNFKEVQPLAVRWLCTNHKTLDEQAVKNITSNDLRARFDVAARDDIEPMEIAVSRDIEPDVVVDEESAAAAAVTEVPKFGEYRSPKQMLDAKPGMYTISDFTNVLEGTQEQIQNTINSLVDSGELEEGEYEGQAVYWPPDLELDLESNIVGISLRFPLNHPEGAASRVVSKKGIYKEMIFVKQEELIGKTKLKYVPLWRVPITEKKL
ncbi:MAG: ATP-binding protein, partial [Candidatus Heimdallarchaeota archaeon]|nr:ATP-binding protein [Candidatus Heimdallarchaeota archaeon]MCK5048670.1 ATP-binding protein [Candidatus Heimdallarchaeota archaeon]